MKGLKTLDKFEEFQMQWIEATRTEEALIKFEETLKFLSYSRSVAAWKPV